MNENKSFTGKVAFVTGAGSANVLNADDYELALSGANEQGQLEAIGYYYFKVTKK